MFFFSHFKLRTKEDLFIFLGEESKNTWLQFTGYRDVEENQQEIEKVFFYTFINRRLFVCDGSSAFDQTKAILSSLTYLPYLWARQFGLDQAPYPSFEDVGLSTMPIMPTGVIMWSQAQNQLKCYVIPTSHLHVDWFTTFWPDRYINLIPLPIDRIIPSNGIIL